MKNRIALAFVLTVIFASSSKALIRSGKLSKQKKEYFDAQFAALSDKLKALETQLNNLSKAVASLEKQQTAFEVSLQSQRQRLQGLKQSLLTVQLGQVEGFANVSSALSRVSSGEQSSFSSLRKAMAQLEQAQQASSAAQSSQAAPSAGPANNTSGNSPAQAPPQGYVTVVSGDTVTIDLGSSAGLQKGSRLDLYDPSDPSTPIGVVEVTDVLDAGDANVKAVSGEKPKFSDIVRPE